MCISQACSAQTDSTVQMTAMLCTRRAPPGADRYGPAPVARGTQQWQNKPVQAMDVAPAAEYQQHHEPASRDNFGRQVAFAMHTISFIRAFVHSFCIQSFFTHCCFITHCRHAHHSNHSFITRFCNAHHFIRSFITHFCHAHH